MLSASMLLDLKHPAYAWYVMIMYLAWDTFMERHLTTLDSTFKKKLMPEIKVRVVAKLYMYSLCDRKMCSQTKFGIPMSNNIFFQIYACETIFLDPMTVVKVRCAP